MLPRDLIATDPVPNFVIPIICFMFYALAFYKARKIEKVEEVTEECSPLLIQNTEQ